jgi:hypothetical protein
LRTLLTLVFLPLVAASFLYLLVIIPVENLRRRLATVRFKRRLFLGLLVLAYVGTFGAAGVGALLQPSLEKAEGARWSVRCDALVDAYRACYGPGWSRDARDRSGAPTHYVVTVEHLGPDGALEVFGRELPFAQVAPALLEPGSTRIVRFDAGTRAVTFELGSQTIHYDLPSP